MLVPLPLAFVYWIHFLVGWFDVLFKVLDELNCWGPDEPEPVEAAASDEDISVGPGNVEQPVTIVTVRRRGREAAPRGRAGAPRRAKKKVT